ncbi:hypothetical protein LS684_21110 (plasmid) [Cytobacillus spongiae]|uniref:phage tail spike protein n=1 Tax=Cytobacillus spongiae TaxID=2901381 RepID=UPI001F352F6F|nr:phage tail spike protein [Cytobacillus spongiae]UII58124.1 hypothetical protein LS684_21110 [Cytobacillus spongiae]
MSMIHILDYQTDEVVGWISNVKTDSHKTAITNEETYDFIVPTSELGADKLTKKRKILIPSEEGDYREFIIQQSETYTTEKEMDIKTSGSFLELKKLKWIPPQVLEGQTVESSGTFILEGLPWKLGIVEYNGIQKWTIDRDINAYDALKSIASLFNCEIRFRVEVKDGEVTGRYVDFIQKVGQDRGKEITAGKDLIGIKRKVNYDRVVTALICLGPEREDGTRLRVTVTDDAAFQNWNYQGLHLIELYEPETNDQEMTEERLTQLGNTELKKRISAAVEYEVEGASLEHILGYEHEKVTLGDSSRVKDELFDPPMYLDSRVIFVERSVFDKTKKRFLLGEVIEYKKEEIFRVWKDLQALYATKVIKSPTPPEGKPNIIWIQTGGKVDVAHTWNAATGKWEKITPTEASEVGSYTQEEVDNKDQGTFEAGTYYSDQVAKNAEDNAKQHTETYAIDKSTYTQKIQDIENELTEKVSKLLYDNNLATLQQDIAAKAGLEYVNGQLVSKADKNNTYTKTEVDNQLNSKVSTTKYTTDQDGVVTQLTNHESRINQTEEGLTSKVSQTSYNQKVSTLETQISQANTLIQQNSDQIQLKASKSELDTLEGRISSTESSLLVQADLIESKVAQTEFDGRMSSAETKINQNTSAINLKASQSSVDSLAGRVSNTEASIQVQSGLIESKVSKTEFQSLEYGIRNLIRNSKGDSLEGFKWWGNTVTTLTTFNNSTWIRVNKSSVNNQVGIHTTPFNMKANKTYIISFDIKSMYNVGYDLNYLFLRYIDSNNNVITVKSIPSVNMRTGFTGDISGNGLRVWFPVSHTSDISNATILIAVSGVSEGAGFAMKEIKVEEGTRPTNWTPAPEDTQEQIKNAEGRVTSAESSISQLSNQIQTKVSENGVISSINQTAEIIKIAASKIQFEGAIFGQNARFAGSIVSTDGSNTLKIDGDSISINDRDIFDSESTLPSMYDGNLSFPIVSAYGKMYLQEITFSIPSGTHSPGSYIEKTLNISNYTRVAIPKVLGFFCHAVAKEWYAYENDSTRVYGGTDIMSTKIRISPHYQYTSGGSSVKVYIMIVGYR